MVNGGELGICHFFQKTERYFNGVLMAWS